MMLRTIALAVAALILALPAKQAFADLGGAQHAQRVVSDLALRQAQVKALVKCQMTAQRRLPTYPPVGTAGPVRIKECPPRLPSED